MFLASLAKWTLGYFPTVCWVTAAVESIFPSVERPLAASEDVLLRRRREA